MKSGSISKEGIFKQKSTPWGYRPKNNVLGDWPKRTVVANGCSPKGKNPMDSKFQFDQYVSAIATTALHRKDHLEKGENSRPTGLLSQSILWALSVKSQAEVSEPFIIHIYLMMMHVYMDLDMGD